MLKAKVIKIISGHELNIDMMQQIAKKTGRPVITISQAMSRIQSISSWKIAEDSMLPGIGNSMVKVFKITIKI